MKTQQENLSKENFWNELYSKYPKGTKLFCDWIDKYKAENEWDFLFLGQKRKHIKFHDIPLAMQMGIFLQFIYETDNPEGDGFREHCVDAIGRFIQEIATNQSDEATKSVSKQNK